jgi:hypothetical protein
MTDRATGAEDGPRRRPLVIAGLPRSGTTWTLGALQRDPNLYPLKEPDSEADRASAIWAKRETGRFPVLSPGDRNDPYHLLWAWILDGAAETTRLRVGGEILRAVSPPAWGKGSRLRSLPTRERRRYLRGGFSPVMWLAGSIAAHPPVQLNPALVGRRLLVKTVHAPLAMDWLGTEFDMDVLVLLRHPGSVLASWIGLDMDAQYGPFSELPAIRRVTEGWGVRPPGPNHLEQMVWQIGVLITALEQAAAHHPSWLVRTHEQLCVDPTQQFRQLYTELGLQWNEEAEAYVIDNNRPGKGFRTRRVAADLPGDWKQRLTPHQIAEMQRVLAWFPLKTWSADDLDVAADG